MWENEIIKGVHATRYIMSWVRMGGQLQTRNQRDSFDEWLELIGLNDSERDTILHLANNGRMELETSASRFIKTLNATK